MKMEILDLNNEEDTKTEVLCLTECHIGNVF